MSSVFVMILAPFLLGALFGIGLQTICNLWHWRHGWVFFAIALCAGPLNFGAVSLVGVSEILDNGGWPGISSAVVGLAMVIFSVIGLAFSLGTSTLPSSGRGWAPTCSLLRGTLRCVFGYGFGNLLLALPISVLGFFVPLKAAALPLYLGILVLLYVLSGTLMERWLGTGRFSPLAVLLGTLIWATVLGMCALFMWSHFLSAQCAHGLIQGSVWGQIYGRLNFPAAVCLGGFAPALPQIGLLLILVISIAPPVLFLIGWLVARLFRQAT